MRAVVHDRYGSPEVLRVEEVARPVPNNDEVLVRVCATTINRSDCGWRSGRPFFSRFFSGVPRPRHQILGSEFAGEIAEIGSAVTTFAVGDHVFGACGFGAHAEFVCVRAHRLIALKPAGISFQAAAAAPDGVFIAGTCLRAANLRAGHRVVVYGASGAIGTAAVQLARIAGAHVAAVCDTRHVDLVASLGADEVIDYTKEDFATRGARYDIVFDAVGKTSFRRCRRAIVRGGTYIETDLGFMWHAPLLALLTRLTSRLGGRRVAFPIPKYEPEHLLALTTLLETGQYRAVIDSVRPLDDAVAATKYVETGQKTGNLVIAVTKEGEQQ